MAENLDKKVNYHESPAYAVARTLRNRGYEIASCTGLRQTEPNHNVVGILKPRDSVRKSFLGLKWDSKQRALYLGTLWLNNQTKGTKHDENWVLEVYGRDNVPELTELVKELSEPSGAHVQVRLDSEQPRVEAYLSDGDF
jgi:hypothetical protein